VNKFLLASALILASAGARAQPLDAGLRLSAGGDGAARLALQADGRSGVLRVSAHFDVDLPVRDSAEAHDKGRWYEGEIRIDGKPCSGARARLHADQGMAQGRASTSCSIGIGADRAVQVEAVVLKAEGVARDEVRVSLAAEKLPQ